MFSNIALKIYSLIKSNKITTNANFWKHFSSLDTLNKIDVDSTCAKQYLLDNNISLICTFDKNFPNIKANIKNSEKPFLLAYKGNIELLNSINNVAVIGTLNPTNNIANREKNIVSELVKNDYIIVSGLANGCDTIAHIETLKKNGKTIAILPTTLENIYPKQNKELVNQIITSGGLVITEYVIETKNKYESINRFIARDRLQAMFSSSTILIASHRFGEGDSGARHAMQKAKEYNKNRYVMYNEKLDKENALFGLNIDLINEGVNILTKNDIKNINKLTILVDLDDTLIFSTELNNDAYNYALEYFNLPRINTKERITRENLLDLPKNLLNKIIQLKQQYFTEKWMNYRLVLNEDLLKLIKKYGKEYCYIWTKSEKIRAEKIVKEYNLDKYFIDIIFDNKNDINDTKKLLQEKTNNNKFLIYENNIEYLKNHTELIKKISNNIFDINKLHMEI